LAEASQGLPKPIAWHEATSAEVRGFLESLEPRAQLRGLKEASSVTQRRYHRVLKKIYDFAVAEGWLEANPSDPAASVSQSESMDSLVFHGIDWQMLLAALPDAQAPLPPADTPWLVVRDAALLRLMMQASLTVAELAGLDVGDVEVAAPPGSPWRHPAGDLWGGLALPGEAASPVGGWTAATAPSPPGSEDAGDDGSAKPQETITLRLDGSRAAQKRPVVLKGAANAAMHAWLRVRAGLPMPRGVASPLLVSRKKAGRLTPRALFHLANRHIGQALSQRYPDRILAHAGPMTLRNSCIVRWLDSGVADSEILQAAGLKDLPALQRLRKHVHPVVARG
jgi:integrase